MDSFDAVVSQFGFMFFDDTPKALREMMRVLRPGGMLAVAVCDAVDHSPGYGAFARLLDRLFGSDVGNAFRAPFALGDPEEDKRTPIRRQRALAHQKHWVRGDPAGGAIPAPAIKVVSVV